MFKRKEACGRKQEPFIRTPNISTSSMGGVLSVPCSSFFDLCEKGSTLPLHCSGEGKRTAFYFFARLLLFEVTRAHNSTAFRISIYNNTLLFSSKYIRRTGMTENKKRKKKPAKKKAKKKAAFEALIGPLYI